MIINIHTHLSNENARPQNSWKFIPKAISTEKGFSKKELYDKFMSRILFRDADMFIKNLDDAGIDKALVMTVDHGMSPAGEAKWSIEEMNQWIAEEVAKYPDRLYALCAVDPRRGDRAIKLIEKAVDEWGMKGVKFHPTSGYYPDDPAFFPLYERMVELDVPLHSHTANVIGPPAMSKYADPIYLDTIAARFVDLNIVMLHCGSISYPYKCMELMLARPNLYAEISGYQLAAFFIPEFFYKVIRDFLKLPALFISAPKDRLMFGSDWPMMGDDKTWVEFVKNIPENAKKYNIKIKKKDIRHILGENAKKFLKL
ncbi:MAG: amidohydrolase family protein [Candidatus Hodarchaeota archaeon]